MHWSQRRARSQNSWGVRKHRSTSPSYQLPKGSRKAFPSHFPTPRLPPPATAQGSSAGRGHPLPSLAPLSLPPLPPRPSTRVPPPRSTPTHKHSILRLVLGFIPAALRPSSPRPAPHPTPHPPVCNSPALPVGQKAPNPRLFLSRHSSLTRSFFPALHPQRHTRVRASPPKTKLLLPGKVS